MSDLKPKNLDSNKINKVLEQFDNGFGRGGSPEVSGEPALSNIL